MARLPLAEQVPEIERRLNLLYLKQKKGNKAMTPAHIAEALAIGKSTLHAWTRQLDEIDPSTIGSGDKPDAELVYDMQDLSKLSDDQLKIIRRQVLRLWLVKGESLMIDIATDRESKSAVTGAVKILETAYDYKKQNEVKLTAGGGWERLINSIE